MIFWYFFIVLVVAPYLLLEGVAEILAFIGKFFE